MTKRYYPPDLSRYAPRVRASMIRRWHALQTERRDWFVCPQHIEFGRAYYCDGERPQVDWHEVYDCNWTPEQWRTRPYKRVYNPVLDATFEYYAKYGYPPLSEYGYGYTRRDWLVTKDGKPHQYFFYDSCDYWAWCFPCDDTLKVFSNGIYVTRYIDGTYSQGTFTTQEPVKKPASELISAVAKRMNAKKYEGAFDPVIDRLVTVYGIRKDQL